MQELWRVDALDKMTTFLKWRQKLDCRRRGMVDSRMIHLEKGHIGNFKNLKKSLYELKWECSLRVYFGRIEYLIILVYGSKSKTKSKQNNAIKLSRGYLKAYRKGELR